MPPPPGRIFAGPQALGPGGLQHALNAATDARGTFVLRLPNGREDFEYVRSRDLVQPLVTERARVQAKRRAPLVSVLCASEAVREVSQQCLSEGTEPPRFPMPRSGPPFLDGV